MERLELEHILSELDKIEDESIDVVMRALRMLLVCCKPDSENGALLIVRAPVDEETWALHIHSLNIDLDDTYIALSKAAHQVAEHINRDAPPHEQLN